VKVLNYIYIYIKSLYTNVLKENKIFSKVLVKDSNIFNILLLLSLFLYKS